MNIVISSGRLQVYGDDVKTYKKIPIGSYNVEFNKMTGFFMTIRPSIEVREEKIYGDSEAKVNKILRAYHYTERNLGVILSGQKGVGKSLFARLLAEKANKEGLPVIIVNSYIPGIADFLASIDQEVVVIFDEFEKTFCAKGDYDPQEELLTLFDGMEGGKKIFIITCNEVHKLNSYLLNRPGRFHYHFVIGNPTPDEIREYMEDKLLPENYDYIDRIIDFAVSVDVTYDYLRAIVFELNMGSTLEEALNDLNITRERDNRYTVIAKFTNGEVYKHYNIRLDLFSDQETTVGISGSNPNSVYTRFTFSPKKRVIENGRMFIIPSEIAISTTLEDFYYEDDESMEQFKHKVEEANVRVISSFEIIKETCEYVNRYVV